MTDQWAGVFFSCQFWEVGFKILWYLPWMAPQNLPIMDTDVTDHLWQRIEELCIDCHNRMVTVRA